MSHPGSTPPTAIGNVPDETPPKKGWSKFLERSAKWFAHKDKGEWLKDMRGNLSLVATVIATMTFQFALNPPGGVVQASDNVDIDCSNRNLTRPCPGQAVLAVVFKDTYFRFLLYNTVSFVTSMTVCLLLVSGLPLNHRFPMWILSIGMCITLTCLALTYLCGMTMVTPDAVWDSAIYVFEYVLMIWIGLLGILGLLLTIRFLVWVVKKWIKKRNTSTTPGNNGVISVNRA